MTTTTPPDLAAFRGYVSKTIGITDLNALGIAGDRAHQQTGGYHLGRSDLQAIGRYHPTAGPGDPHEDYSARQARDRAGLTDDASAIDIDHAWHNGGPNAWLRWNNLVVRDLRAGVPTLAAVRAVNTTLDGTTLRRFDRVNGFTPEATTDQGHTHIEFWRDTAGTAGRGAALAHLANLMPEAITGVETMTRTPDDVFNLVAGIVNGDTAPMGVNSQIPGWIRTLQAAAADLSSVKVTIGDVRADVEALQHNQAAPASAAAIAGEIIKQLGLIPK